MIAICSPEFAFDFVVAMLDEEERVFSAAYWDRDCDLTYCAGGPL